MSTTGNTLEAFIKGTPVVRAAASGRPVKEFSFAGAGGRFASVRWGLRMLTADEVTRCRANAIAYMKSVGYTEESFFLSDGEATLQLQVKIEQLALALVTPDDARTPMLADAQQLRSTLEVDEVVMLYEHFLDYTIERSPLYTAKSWEDIEKVVEAVGNGTAPPSSLTGYDNGTLRRILLVLAARSAGQTKQSSSDSSPSKEQTSISVDD